MSARGRIEGALRGVGTGRLIGAAGAALVTLSAVALLARAAAEPDMALLYARLDPPAAGGVIDALEGAGVRYEVRGDAIYVPAAERDALRLSLAAQGATLDGQGGYELLEGLGGFGATAQMFDAAYWRAKEGELARTIMSGAGLSGAGVDSARVHIAVTGGSPFSRRQAPAASVTLNARAGPVPPELARAVQALIAGAVPELAPAAVTVIDGRFGKIVSTDREAQAALGGAERAAALQQAAENILFAQVGAGNYVVEVNVETTRERERLTERAVDPEAAAVVSAERETRSTNSTNRAESGVSVASQLPDGDAAQGSAASAASEDVLERTNYEHSTREREIERPPGAIKRITVAVLLDGVVAPDAEGNPAWAPRDEAELAAIRELVASAVGLDTERGDVLSVRTMRFAPAAELGQAAPEAAPWLGRAGALRLAALAALALLGLVALLVAARLMRPAPAAPGAGDDPAAAGEGMRLAGPQGDARALPGLPGPVGEAGLPTITGMDAMDDGEGPVGLIEGGAAPHGARGAVEDAGDPVARLQALITERREETVEVLRSWIAGAPAPGGDGPAPGGEAAR